MCVLERSGKEWLVIMKELFLKRMEEYLKEEYPKYLETLEEDAYRGLRVNTSKISVEEFLKLGVCSLRPSSICPQSFYLPKEVEGLGNHPAHLAGLFYMQEPSASSAVEVLGVEEGDWVLDMCAAPGGKSTQIAAKLNHSGFLVSNEIEPKRAMALLSNMERLGFSECMITNAHPKDLEKEMHGWFDKVLVDAPCSGEGMFKKHSKAMEDWSVEHVEACAQRQLHILDSAYETLKEGGILVYSTCTYSMEENEHVVYEFLKKYADMELIDSGVSFGRCGFAYKDLEVEKVRRIFPMDEGEGHFVAKFKKNRSSSYDRRKEVTSKIDPCAASFLKQQLTLLPSYTLQIQDKVYAKNTPFIKLKNIHILRQGILCGNIVKNRFEPHQHFYSAQVHQGCFVQIYDMNEEETQRYLKGNLLPVTGYKGYTALTWKHHPIAFAKGDGSVLKNKYPKGMRLR